MALPNVPLVTLEEIQNFVGNRVNVYLYGVDVLLAQHLRYVGITRSDQSKIVIAALFLQNSDPAGQSPPAGVHRKIPAERRKTNSNAPNSELKKLKEKRRSLIQIRATTNNRCTIIDAAFCQRVLSACIHPPLDENYILFAEQNGQELELKYQDDLGDSEKSFYKSDVEVSLDQAVQICLDTISQSDPRWKRERHSRMTASDAYLYISPWLKPAHAVNWNEKVRKYLTTDFKGNPATHYGSRMEPRARECYAKMVKQDVVLSGLMIDPAIPWLGFSPDGFVPNLNRIIEIECPHKFKDSPVHELIEKNSHS
ncbi:hypothetical protein QAD02_021672 [Eretmocerus hayati]|uniref:Uncharacterized protein n=1 Tax=Eretmocerus hayati TaxID=131215 RepID=A0ACC2PTD9_9HYME|nr:hypothetical protein QAD02_021672 [Eretmocerus hayati]